MTFQEAAISSAERYYQFLSKEGKGKIERKVINREIADDFVKINNQFSK